MNSRGGRGRRQEGWRLRHITFPQCIKGTGLSVTHTVRKGGGEGDGEETEGGRDGGDRMEERRSLLSYLPSFSILPSLMSDVIQVTYSSS